MQYDPAVVAEMVEKAVRRDDRRPAFHAVAGSHMYGFASEAGGDVDVRGFHVADGERYASLDEPDEQIVVNQGDVTEGFEEYAEIDLVSYELKKFGSLLYGANFNVLEVLFDGIEVVDDVPAEVDALRELVEAELPLDVPRSYVGMARTNYRNYLDPDAPSYAPTAKRYLYVLRGLLAARYVVDEERIRADVRDLSRHVLGTTGTVDELIAAKRSAAGATVDGDLAARADDLIADLLDAVDPPDRVEKERYRERLDEWMLSVRRSGR